jgi:hypothetical protein
MRFEVGIVNPPSISLRMECRLRLKRLLLVPANYANEQAKLALLLYDNYAISQDQETVKVLRIWSTNLSLYSGAQSRNHKKKITLVPKLKLGNSVWEAPASRLAKLRLAWTGNDPVISLHFPHPCGSCRRQSTKSRRSRRRRSGCRELRFRGSQSGYWKPALKPTPRLNFNVRNINEKMHMGAVQPV